MNTYLLIKSSLLGSKVCITTPAHTGMVLSTREKVTFPEAKRYFYVTGYEIRCKEVVPILMKAKKDGTISKNSGLYNIRKSDS